jgi:hypothetical protein
LSQIAATNDADVLPAPLPAALWSIEKHNDACFIVRDGTGQALGYF